MSVINNVLKDLESRSSQFTPIEIASINRSGSQAGKSWVMPVTGFLLVLCLVVGAYWMYLQQTGSGVVKLASVPETVVEPVSQPVVVDVIKEVQSNQIIGMQIKETPTQVSLEFSMREKAISYLKERGESSFVYHLKNIDSEIVAPLIRDNRWIEKLAIIQHDEGVDVAFQTVAGVLVNTEQIQKQDESIWVIQLEKLPDAIVVNAVPDSAIEPASVTAGVSKLAEVVVASNSARAEASPEIEEEKPGEPIKLDIKSSSKELNENNQFNRAKELIKSRDWRTAETLLLGLIGGPQDIVAREQLLGIYSQPAYASQYASLARQSISRYPDNNLFKTEYARTQFKRQSYQSAINLLQSIEEPNSIQLALMAASHQRLDEHEKAIEFYQRSLRLDKQQAKNWIGLGISLEHNAQLKLALQSYLTAAKLGSLNPRLTEFVAKRSKTLKQVIN